MYGRPAILAIGLAVGLATATAADAGEAERAAAGMAEALETASDGGIQCGVQDDAQAIICIANADEAFADRIAAYAVTLARAHDLPLAGWSISVATPADYVVSYRF